MADKDDPKWKDAHEDTGRRVFTRIGTAFIEKYDPKAKRYLVQMEKSGDYKDLPEKSVKFKAINDLYRESYETDKRVKTESGSPSVCNGDKLAIALKGQPLAKIKAIAKENGIDPKRWEHLSPGMQSMNIRNVLRRLMREHLKDPLNPCVIIDGEEVTYAMQKNQHRINQIEEPKND